MLLLAHRLRRGACVQGYLLRGTRKLLIPRTLYLSRDWYRYRGYEPRNRAPQRGVAWGCPRPAKAGFKKGTLKWPRNCWGSNSKPITINPLESVNAPRPTGVSKSAGMQEGYPPHACAMLSRLFSTPNNQCGIDYWSSMLRLLVRVDDFVFEFAFSASRTSTSHPNVVYVITAYIWAQTIILLNQLELFAFGRIACRH
jgi:hypothetical protein